MGTTEAEKAHYVWNAKVQVTTWGNRVAADEGGLRDYSHREWSGLLKEFYAMRWKHYIDNVLKHWGEEKLPAIDFYSLEESWVNQPYKEVK